MLQEQRYKRIYLSNERLLDIFLKPRQYFNDDLFYLNSYILPGLPEDYEVKHVNWDHHYCAWCLTIYNKEFPIIKIGEIIPILEWNDKLIILETRYIKEERKKYFL